MVQKDSGRERDAALRALLANKFHTLPDVRSLSSGTLLKNLVGQVRPLPGGLLGWWATHPRGHVVVTGEARGYVPGPQEAGAYALHGVAWLSAGDLLADSLRPLDAIVQLLDHLLGSDGEADGQWLSEGGGINMRWREVGKRLTELFALGYGPTDQVRADPHAYFAWGFALSLRDARALNTTDPRMERLLRTTVLSDTFWCSALSDR